MLELEEAIMRVLAALPPALPDKVSLQEAYGRVLLEPVISPIDLPPFDNSAMDGYAARSQDIADSSSRQPVRLRLAGRVAAGESFSGQVEKGSCIRLFTGSRLPTGADCVVMQEDTQLNPDAASEVLIIEGAKPWENVRMAGEDVRKGAELAHAGEPINAGTISLLASAGITDVVVGKQPVVGLVATGSELRQAGESLGEGQIYESNRVGLIALIQRAGGIPRAFPIVHDSLDTTTRALSEALESCDLVVTVGGASVGDLDLIKPAMANLGVSLDFWRIAMKPGRPFLFGHAQQRLVCGLPGNPVSALVTFLLLVWPAIKKWQGAEKPELPSVPSILSEPVHNPGSRRHFVRVKLDSSGKASLAGAQASHLLSSFARASGLIDIPPQTTLPAGRKVLVRIWEL